MAPELTQKRKRDKIKEFLHFGRPIKTQKAFAKSQSFEKDIAILSAAYILQGSPELKRLIQLIAVISDKDSEGQLTDVLETCGRFSVQLASATNAQHAEATQAIKAFNKTVEKLNTIPLDGDAKSLGELKRMVKTDIGEIRPSFMRDGDVGTSEGLSRVLDLTIGTTISVLSIINQVSSLIPVPWVQPLVGAVVSMLQAVSQTRSNYNDMKQVVATAGDFVVSCAVICSESAVAPSAELKRALNQFTKELEIVAEECNKLSELKLFSRYLQQSTHKGDLQAIRTRLNTAVERFQNDTLVNLKLDTEALNRKFDFTSLSGLRSHPYYTRNEYLDKSRDDVISDVSEWIANARESVLWVHGAAGLGKSTVAQQLVHLLQSDDRLAGGVFLTHITEEHPNIVVQMVSKQLGEMHPQAIVNIAEAARKLNSPHGLLSEYLAAYLLNPICALKYPYQLVIIIDALDEWTSHEPFLMELAHIPSDSPLKFILTSRFSHSIERVLDRVPIAIQKYPLPPASQAVIECYFHHHFLSNNNHWRGRKPDHGTIQRLAARADGLLIWAATARSLVMNKLDTRYPHVILDQILSSEERVVAQNGGQLERLYSSALSTLFPLNSQGMLRSFLGATMILQETLPIGDFAHLLGIPEQPIEEIHQRLAALQTQGDFKINVIPPAVQQFHASFLEFIQSSPVESDEHTFPVISIVEAHSMLADRCLKIVFSELFSSFRGQICTSAGLCGVEPYAIKFWPMHLSNGTSADVSEGSALRKISDMAMQRWATLFLPCVSPRLQDENFLNNVPKFSLLYNLALVIGKKDITTGSISYPLPRGKAYDRLYKQSRYKGILDQEIKAWRQALELISDEPSEQEAATIVVVGDSRRQTDARKADARSSILSWLGHGLYTRFSQQGASNDLEEAIYLHQEALVLRPAPHPNRSWSLNNLALALKTRFSHEGASNDLEEAILLYQQALVLCPAPHLNRFGSLNNLALALKTRFSWQGALSDLEEAILLYQEALVLHPDPHPNRFSSLNNLASALQTRFDQQGASNDLEEAISLHQQALVLCPAPYPNHFSSLNNLASALKTRFDQQGALNDLEEAISLHREALVLHPAPHPNRSASLNDLALALKTRFDQQGGSNDLEEAIFLHREALILRPAPCPNRSWSLNDLALALRTRFDQQGASDDLEEAIFLHREAIVLCLAPHLNRSWSLNNLASALQTRFYKQDCLNDLEEAISLHREALILRPAPHLNRSSSLNNLASALQTRFERQGASNDLEEAISLHREALVLHPAPHPKHSSSLNNLALALQTRFEKQGASNDLEEAILLHQQALVP